ncbi:solute carrier family 52, riboflavin transporter, member 3-like [Physella acuta]|uniref:solute carrier family 52, riboflavin transporter, member 3-like n=1 Tax=Physella acuta TaxID=109671 RepID=UPI0027DAC871|nr:solute carrier family 52, riboflavin transporter, member 3-like [Physella acuta]XP_059177732.1 solute carrier family 52, riboflavin transporter, member 3-like [Physella acuta]
MSQDFCRCGRINILVYVLVILFAVSSWVDMNGLWMELPILVQNLPEGWDLPSYMGVVIQIANIAPLAYTIANTRWPGRRLELPVIYVIIVLGAVSCLLLAYLWDVTSDIAGESHSTALLVLQFFLALVDCTSSVAFLPFMSVFKPQYMTAYFLGEGFSGLIPSLVALAQGAGTMECQNFPININKTIDVNNNSHHYTKDDIERNTTFLFFKEDLNNSSSPIAFMRYPVYQEPKFSVRTFFLFLMALLTLSVIAFTLLNFWSYCQQEYAQLAPEDEKEKPETEDSEVQLEFNETENCVMITSTNNQNLGSDKNSCIHKNKISDRHTQTYSFSDKINGNTKPVSKVKVVHPKLSEIPVVINKPESKMPRSKYIMFMLFTFWLNALSNGVMFSIQTYSCLPYGLDVYHLSITLSCISNPLACLVCIFLTMRSLAKTSWMTSVATLFAVYIIYTAARSPDPPLVGYISGSIITVTVWTLGVFTMTYCKVSIATEFRSEGKRALMWVGAATQAGSLVGAIVTFVLINVYKVLTVANPCR